MVTCPWCGTTYEPFLSNCKRCGGTIPPPAESHAAGHEGSVATPPTPPPPPRTVSGSYVWRVLGADGWAIACLVFGLLGTIFTSVGVPLTLARVTAFVGIPFAVFGLLSLAAATALGAWRYREAQQTVEVMRTGEVVEGRIVELTQNLSVRINGRSPWVIRYEFVTAGQAYEGQASTLKTPGPALQQGQRACVLYLPQAPARNVLYPRP